MRNASLALFALLTACSSNPQNVAAELAAGYTAEAAAVSAYASLPNADLAVLAELRACDQAAYNVVSPVTKALTAGTSVSDAMIANAQASLTAATACLAKLGVKI